MPDKSHFENIPGEKFRSWLLLLPSNFPCIEVNVSASCPLAFEIIENDLSSLPFISVILTAAMNSKSYRC
jgi:hypothetical protein